jgi:hypothetical protein
MSKASNDIRFGQGCAEVLRREAARKSWRRNIERLGKIRKTLALGDVNFTKELVAAPFGQFGVR